MHLFSVVFSQDVNLRKKCGDLKFILITLSDNGLLKVVISSLATDNMISNEIGIFFSGKKN